MTPTFYLGTHEVSWLGTVGVPLFVSHTRLRDRKRLPRALAPWAVDSGAFTELSRHGRWTTTPAEYADAVVRYRDEVGNLQWAAPQDWLCDPLVRAGGQAGPITFVGTGRSLGEHLEATVTNLLELRAVAPDVPWVPVLQGWRLDDYLTCAALYEQAGVRLEEEPTVGLGSIVNRQHTGEVERIVSTFHDRGLRLHGFGVKGPGLALYGDRLASADSMAWSFAARMDHPLPGCAHRSCANCSRYALQWRDRMLLLASTQQQRLFG